MAQLLGSLTAGQLQTQFPLECIASTSLSLPAKLSRAQHSKQASMGQHEATAATPVASSHGVCYLLSISVRELEEEPVAQLGPHHLCPTACAPSRGQSCKCRSWGTCSPQHPGTHSRGICGLQTELEGITSFLPHPRPCSSEWPGI